MVVTLGEDTVSLAGELLFELGYREKKDARLRNMVEMTFSYLAVSRQAENWMS